MKFLILIMVCSLGIIDASLAEGISVNSTATPAPTPIDWTQFSDSVFIQIERPPGNKTGNTVCSGVIIHPHAVLTTAHCADGARSMTVVFDVENGIAAQKKEWIPQKSIHLHPNYRHEKSLYGSDLAIIFLEKPAPIDEKLIRKIPEHLALHAGDRLVRIGMGLRNGMNSRNFTDPTFVKIKSEGVFETSDVASFVGDSGGPVYSVNHDLLAIHSTLDDFDHKATPHVYSVYLPHYQAWIQAQLKTKGYTLNTSR